MRKRLVFALFIIMSGLVQGEASADTAVLMERSSYVPKDVVVKAGETVLWTNKDAANHTVTAEDGSFDSSPKCGDRGACISQGGTFKKKFAKAGTFAYYCRLHGAPGGQAMAGTVTVTG